MNENVLILNDVTLVCITTVRVERAIKALKFSSKNIKFNSVKLFTQEIVNDSDIEVIQINNLNYEDYSKFVVYDLHKYINTSHALIIQDDGFVVNPDKWDDEFLKYDYIGAIWKLPEDNFSYRDIFGKIIRVGNGGFSLRSKQLLSLATKLNLTWKPYFGYWNEDGFFTCHNRHIYEMHGCVFPTVEVASRFSHEHPVKENENIIPFGFHGKNHQYYNLIN